MYIVDYSNDYHGQKVETQIFEGATSKDDILTFVASMSVHSNFELKRINKYARGKLLPYDLKLKNGRLVVEEASELSPTEGLI